MILILLGGNSFSNKSWLKGVEEEMGAYFPRIVSHSYKHWEDETAIIDMDSEVDRFTEEASQEEKFLVFAKSVGILVALKAIYEGKLLPEKCMFLGLPIRWARDNHFDIDNWLKNFPIPAIFIQHTGDPAASFEEVVRYVNEKAVKRAEFVELSGDSHAYPEVPTLAKLAKEFFLEKKNSSR